MANSVTTLKARQKIAKAHADGSAVPRISQVGWGTGGVDINNAIIMPTADQTIVSGQIFKNNILSYTYNSLTATISFHCQLSSEDVGVLGQEISSFGLYDTDGDLVAIKNFGSKSMGQDVVISVDWNENIN